MSKKKINGRERRSYVRLETELPVKFRISGEYDKIYSAITKNISHGGICLEVSQRQDELFEWLSSADSWPIMEVAPVLPNLNNAHLHQPAWITSRLEWAKMPSAKRPSLLMGMNFVEIAEATRKHIFDYIVSEFLKHYDHVNI